MRNTAMNAPTNRRTATLGVYFEGESLFAATWVERLGSAEDARALLRAGLTLRVDAGGVVLHAGARPVRRLREWEDDEFGRWPDDADRRCEEAYRAAFISEDEFLAGAAPHEGLRLGWYGITEYVSDAEGNLLAMETVASEHIRTPATG